jgi:hypothetical protein
MDAAVPELRDMTRRKADGLVQTESDILAVGLDLQQQGLELLLAEMRALSALMPGEDSRKPTDAEIEAGFDNMPI